jgi:hypothetical protein
LRYRISQIQNGVFTLPKDTRVFDTLEEAEAHLKTHGIPSDLNLFGVQEVFEDGSVGTVKSPDELRLSAGILQDSCIRDVLDEFANIPEEPLELKPDTKGTWLKTWGYKT